jgi:hypothetical protein
VGLGSHDAERGVATDAVCAADGGADVEAQPLAVARPPAAAACSKQRAAQVPPVDIQLQLTMLQELVSVRRGHVQHCLRARLKPRRIQRLHHSRYPPYHVTRGRHSHNQRDRVAAHLGC